MDGCGCRRVCVGAGMGEDATDVGMGGGVGGG